MLTPLVMPFLVSHFLNYVNYELFIADFRTFQPQKITTYGPYIELSRIRFIRIIFQQHELRYIFQPNPQIKTATTK